MTATNLLDTNIPGAKAGSEQFFRNKQSDTIFHLSPFAQLHENTIAPIHVNINPEDVHPGVGECGSGLSDDVLDNQSRQVSFYLTARAYNFVDYSDTQFDGVPGPHAVPTPSSAIEAYLLLEAARADQQVWLTRQNLVHQIIRRNTLTLQYNRVMLEKAQDELRAADRFVGHVRATIRRSGVTTAFEYAMREDYSSAGISGEPRLGQIFSICLIQIQLLGSPQSVLLDVMLD